MARPRTNPRSPRIAAMRCIRHPAQCASSAALAELFLCDPETHPAAGRPFIDLLLRERLDDGAPDRRESWLRRPTIDSPFVAGRSGPIPKAAARTGRVSRAAQALRLNASRGAPPLSYVGETQDRGGNQSRGVALSVSTIGRILARLAARGAIEPVALLRRRPASRRFRYRRAALCPAPAKGPKSQGSR
jgi:hypothetical protein